MEPDAKPDGVVDVFNDVVAMIRKSSDARLPEPPRAPDPELTRLQTALEAREQRATAPTSTDEVATAVLSGWPTTRPKYAYDVAKFTLEVMNDPAAMHGIPVDLFNGENTASSSRASMEEFSRHLQGEWAQDNPWIPDRPRGASSAARQPGVRFPLDELLMVLGYVSIRPGGLEPLLRGMYHVSSAAARAAARNFRETLEHAVGCGGTVVGGYVDLVRILLDERRRGLRDQTRAERDRLARDQRRLDEAVRAIERQATTVMRDPQWAAHPIQSTNGMLDVGLGETRLIDVMADPSGNPREPATPKSTPEPPAPEEPFRRPRRPVRRPAGG